MKTDKGSRELKSAFKVKVTFGKINKNYQQIT